MRPILALAVFGLMTSPALAARGYVAPVNPSPAGPLPVERVPYDPAPWWMRDPVIAATGQVELRLPANRASFDASFQAVKATAAEASAAATTQVRELSAVLLKFGTEKVRVETSLAITPLYDQYRDKDGNLITNARADKIERYQANINVSLDVRDVTVIERAYATVVAALPTSTSAVNFRLEPDNETRTELFKSAVADAARRARLAVEAAGTRLGAVKLIDPTGRACETDVLVAGAPRDGAGPALADVEARPVMAMAPPPSPRAYREQASLEERAAALQLTLQPPVQSLEARACVVYGLAGN